MPAEQGYIMDLSKANVVERIETKTHLDGILGINIGADRSN